MNLIQKILRIALIPIVAFGLKGCQCDRTEYFTKYKKKDNLTMRSWNDGMGNHFRIDEGKEESETPYLHAIDGRVYSDTLDERFDEVTLRYVPKGHRIEEYANLDSINKLYKEVKETGENY